MQQKVGLERARRANRDTWPLDPTAEGAPRSLRTKVNGGAANPQTPTASAVSGRETLVGAPAQRADAVFTVTGEKSMAIQMRHPHSAGDEFPVIELNRRGDLVAGMVRPEQPFPGFHGRGERRERPGDPLPHVAGVTKIAISYEQTD